MSVSSEQLRQSVEIKSQYRPLDVSKREIRLLSFEDTTEYGPIRLSLHHVSLNDWKPEYASFRDQNALGERPRHHPHAMYQVPT